MRFLKLFLIVTKLSFCLLSCKSDNETTPTPTTQRVYETSFETEEEFSDFYITPQGHLGTTYQELSDSIVLDGNYSHLAWVVDTNAPSTTTINNNHRGYPTIQFQKTEEGVFTTPCYVTFWVWLDMPLYADPEGIEDDWFSFATFSDDESDYWSRTIVVNVSYDGFVHLQHVPYQGEQVHIYQNDTLTFPQREWVELKVYLDFGENAYAKVWQNGTLVSHALISDIDNQLAQVDFGMYSPPSVSSGLIFNDKLRIETVEEE